MTKENAHPAQPKAFISYSWSSPGHRELVRTWADRLLADGIEIIIDQYDLKEGHDKFAFMEKMVTDPSVSHVLVISDKKYAEKADARQAGVGTESQIISQEVYAKVEQSKFIPIVVELNDQNEPFLPVFLKSRIWINFSSAEFVNENWEQLIRVLFGKPAFQKPSVGLAPSYVTQDVFAPSNPAISRFAVFKQAVLQGKKGIKMYRADFLNACFSFADPFRTRQEPNANDFAEKVLETSTQLLPIRNLFVDWILLEAPEPSPDFFDALSEVLERLVEFRARPKEVTSWNDSWFEAAELFVYESFLYIVAALLRANAFAMIHEVLKQSYVEAETERQHGNGFARFDRFLAYSGSLNKVLAPPGNRLLSPAAALIQKQATRADMTFTSVIEADLLAALFAAVSDLNWLPQTLVYAGYQPLPFFFRATQRKHYVKLATITGCQTGDELRTKAKEGLKRIVGTSNEFFFRSNMSISRSANLDKLDTIP